LSVAQLAQSPNYGKGYPNTNISYTTTADLLDVDVTVVRTPFPDRGNPFHATAQVPDPLDPAQAGQISAVFKRMANPAKCN